MPTKKKFKASADKKRKSGKSKRTVRIYFFSVLVLAVCCFFIFFSGKSLKKIPLLEDMVQQYNRIRDMKDTFAAVTWDATLCFGDEKSDFLIKEFRKISCLPQPEKKATVLINELIKGPQAKGVRTLPASTKLRSVELADDGLMVVDLSADLIKQHPGGSASEMMTVFSLVNTITMNIREVNRVRLMVDGKTVESIAGHIDCREPIAPQPALVH